MYPLNDVDLLSTDLFDFVFFQASNITVEFFFQGKMCVRQCQEGFQ